LIPNSIKGWTMTRPLKSIIIKSSSNLNFSLCGLGMLLFFNNNRLESLHLTNVVFTKKNRTYVDKFCSKLRHLSVKLSIYSNDWIYKRLNSVNHQLLPSNLTMIETLDINLTNAYRTTHVLVEFLEKSLSSNPCLKIFTFKA
jgi:hypothetical protein